MSNKQIEILQSAANQARKDGDEKQATFIEAQIRKIKRHVKNKKRQQEKIKRVESIEAPTDHLSWEMGDELGNRVIGIYEDVKVFEITKGMVLYRLDVIGKNLVESNNGNDRHSSTHISTLKKKADKIVAKFLKEQGYDKSSK